VLSSVTSKSSGGFGSSKATLLARLYLFNALFKEFGALDLRPNLVRATAVKKASLPLLLRISLMGCTNALLYF
jgi:hypothetical protein